MKFLTKEQQKPHENAHEMQMHTKICYICKEKIENKLLKDKKV